MQSAGTRVHMEAGSIAFSFCEEALTTSETVRGRGFWELPPSCGIALETCTQYWKGIRGTLVSMFHTEVVEKQ